MREKGGEKGVAAAVCCMLRGVAARVGAGMAVCCMLRGVAWLLGWVRGWRCGGDVEAV